MALSCEHDALDALRSLRSKGHITNWPASKTVKLADGNTAFHLTTGENVFLHLISNDARREGSKPKFVAIFRLSRPETKALNSDLLPQCQSGGLVIGPDDKGWSRVEGLKIAKFQYPGEYTLVLFETTGHQTGGFRLIPPPSKTRARKT